MGVVGAVIGTLGAAYLSGRAQQEQMEAQARQAEANARLQASQAEYAARNADKANKNAEEMARVNAQNVENERRKMLLYEGKQNARISASGITATGSALNALADTRWDIDRETATQLYNGQQDVYKQFRQGTDYANQSLDHKYQSQVYQKEASDYRAAGRNAMTYSLIGGGLQLAGRLSPILYSSKSSAAQSAGGSFTAPTGWNFSTGSFNQGVPWGSRGKGL